MTAEELSELHKDIPEIIESSITMSEPNTPIKIYEGVYRLKADSKEFEVQGVINFDWTANSGSHFSGNIQTEPSDYNFFSDTHDLLQILIDGLEFGKGFITNTSFGFGTNSTFVKGTLSQDAVLGDKSIAVEKIRFSIPNLRSFHGLPVKKTTTTNILTARNRLQFENDNFTITIDKCSNYRELTDSLNEKGGFLILYHGELTSKKGSVKRDDTKDIFHCLDTFLSFLNGRRTSAMFLQGICSDELIWTDFTEYFVDPYKTARSWPPRHSITGLNELWQKFSSLWKDPDDKNFLTSAIHWYIEANNNSGLSEGAIIMAQTALELLYNWWIIEQKKLIIGKDSENISASNKIRLLLSQLNTSHATPERFTELQRFIGTSNEIIDAVDAVVQIRNAIVHSQEEKRRKLSSINYMAKHEGLQLCLWYIELALLCILDFDDIYVNRCSKELYAAKMEELVPWTKKS